MSATATKIYHPRKLMAHSASSSRLVTVIPSLASSLSELSAFNPLEASFIITCIRSFNGVPHGRSLMPGQAESFSLWE